MIPLLEAQEKYLQAKQLNHHLRQRAKVRNKDLYEKLDKLEGCPRKDEHKIVELFKEISRKNEELGLYRSNDELDAAENELLDVARAEIKKFCEDKGMEDKFEYLDRNAFRNKNLKYSVRGREELLKLCLKWKPEQFLKAV